MTKTEKHKHTAAKHSAVVKNQHTAEKWAQTEKPSVIFVATAENRVGTTKQHYAQAHSKHSKRSYALFYDLRIAAQQRNATNSV